MADGPGGSSDEHGLVPPWSDPSDPSMRTPTKGPTKRPKGPISPLKTSGTVIDRSATLEGKAARGALRRRRALALEAHRRAAGRLSREGAPSANGRQLGP